MNQINSTDFHALAQQMAFNGIPATEFRICGNRRMEAHYITQDANFWDVPTVVSSGRMTHRKAMELVENTAFHKSPLGTKDSNPYVL